MAAASKFPRSICRSLANTYRFPDLPLDAFHGVPGLLADSLPDRFGNAVIDSWLTSLGRTPDSLNVIERLCFTGARGMGALEYVPVTGPDASGNDPVDLAAHQMTVNGKSSDISREDLIICSKNMGVSRPKAESPPLSCSQESRYGMRIRSPFSSRNDWSLIYTGFTNMPEKLTVATWLVSEDTAVRNEPILYKDEVTRS